MNLTLAERDILTNLALGFTLRQTAIKAKYTYGSLRVILCKMRKEFKCKTDIQLVTKAILLGAIYVDKNIFQTNSQLTPVK